MSVFFYATCLHYFQIKLFVLAQTCYLPLLTSSCVSGPPAVRFQYMQKKNPLYSQLKEDTVWSMESFNAYINDRFQAAKDLPRDWVLGAFAVSAVL